MKRILPKLFLVSAILWCNFSVHAQVVTYTDETAFLNALAAQSYVAIQESFEDDAAWGSVRGATATSITSLGITWSSSSTNNSITTGSGPARTGNWGFYSLPHGDYANGITDGWRGVASQSLVAIGGWVESNTPPAGIAVFLDGDELNPVDFGGNANSLGTASKFFGVIDPNGFSVFDFRETEGTIGDQKLIFSDDFTFAFGGTVLDCNQNGLADHFDLANFTSNDCNHNFIPDECEWSVNNPNPGYCTENCLQECNNNNILDVCEAITPVLFNSAELTPIGNGSPQSFTIVQPPTSLADVVLNFTAYANLGGGPDLINVDINGVSVGTVFGNGASDCPEQQPDAGQIIVPVDTFNIAVNGGDATINMVATAEVDPNGCDPQTYITVEAQIFVPSELDLNGNGILDECESNIPTASEWGMIVLTLMLSIVGTLFLMLKKQTAPMI